MSRAMRGNSAGPAAPRRSAGVLMATSLLAVVAAAGRRARLRSLARCHGGVFVESASRAIRPDAPGRRFSFLLIAGALGQSTRCPGPAGGGQYVPGPSPSGLRSYPPAMGTQWRALWSTEC